MVRQRKYVFRVKGEENSAAFETDTVHNARRRCYPSSTRPRRGPHSGRPHCCRQWARVTETEPRAGQGGRVGTPEKCRQDGGQGCGWGRTRSGRGRSVGQNRGKTDVFFRPAESDHKFPEAVAGTRGKVSEREPEENTGEVGSGSLWKR